MGAAATGGGAVTAGEGTGAIGAAGVVFGGCANGWARAAGTNGWGAGRNDGCAVGGNAVGAPNVGCAAGGANVGRAAGAGGIGAGVGCGKRAGAVAAASAAERQLVPGIGALVIGARAAGADRTGLNSTGKDEIARGFANGITFVGVAVALPDRIDGSGAPEREPVGEAGARSTRALRADLDGGGTRRASTMVASSPSNGRGTWGMTRSCVTGSCAILGRDFRVLIG
jgi:hypothetical protein